MPRIEYDDAAAEAFQAGRQLALWARISLHATVWCRDGGPVAYSYRGPEGLSPVAGIDAASAAQALQHELAGCADEHVQVSIPGTVTALARVAIAAGLRVEDPGLLLVCPSNQRLPDARAIHSYWLI